MMMSYLHSVVSNAPPLADFIREVDVSDQILSLELVVGIAGVQLALINRFVFVLFLVVFNFSWLDIVSLVDIFLFLGLG